MAEQAEFDLVSIGGGFAGLVAALRGAELGLRTAVIEKGADERYLCSSRWAGGIFHVSYHDVVAARRSEGGDRARDFGRDRPGARRRNRRGLRPHNRLAGRAGREFHQRQPDKLAPLDAGAAARSCRMARTGGAAVRT